MSKIGDKFNKYLINKHPELVRKPYPEKSRIQIAGLTLAAVF